MKNSPFAKIIAFLSLIIVLLVPVWAATSSTDDDAEKYLIHAGDKLNIQVYDEKDLSGVFLVDSTGMINYPLLGEISTEKLSIDEFKKLLKEKLGSDYLINPQVEVSYVESPSKAIAVLGQVVKPGNYIARPKLTLAKLIPEVGGFTPNALTSKVKISRPSESGKRNLIEVDADAIIKGKIEDVSLFPGDMVMVDVMADKAKEEGPFVTILGQVRSPGNYTVKKNGTTLIGLIGETGGFTPVASTSHVRIVRKLKDGKEKIFFVDAGMLMSGKGKDFNLEAGDLIVVEESYF